MLDFLRLGSEQHVHVPPGWRKTACRLVGHRGFGFAIKLWALRRQLQCLPRDLEVGSVLDFGCGDGMYSFFLRSQFPQAHIDGIDGDPESIRAATQVAASSPRYQNMTFQTTRFENFTPSAQYDLVVCLDSIYYTEQGLDILAKACRCVRPGGYLVMSCPRLQRHYGKNFDYYVGHVDVERLDGLFQPDRTAEVIQNNDLEVVALDDYPSGFARTLVEQQRSRRWHVSLFYPAYLGLTWLGRRGTSQTASHYMYLARGSKAA